MASVSALTVQPSKMRTTQGFHQYQHQRRPSSVTVIRDMPRKKQSLVPVMRLFGPAIFEASKLKVLFVDGPQHPWKLPRTYTLTHSDVTSMLTLVISETINNSQLPESDLSDSTEQGYDSRRIVMSILAHGFLSIIMLGYLGFIHNQS